MQRKQKLELTWIGKDEEPRLEPRILIEDPDKSYGAKDTQNMLIHGDNLLALKALEQNYSGKIKCIYIDPPFNTGQAFEHYDDSVEHSKWLSLLKDRITVLFKLLTRDGLFWIHLDDTEVHYTKILLDEIFGRQNFVIQINYERSGSAGIGQGGAIVDTTEYILLYKKEAVDLNAIEYSQPLDKSVMKRYSKILKHEGTKKLIKEFKSKSNGLPVKIYKHENFDISAISLRSYEERIEEIKEEYVDNYAHIFRTTNPQKENSFQQELIGSMDKNCMYTVEYVPSRGRYKDIETILYYYNSEIFAWLKDSAKLIDKEVVKTNKLTNFWSHADIPKADLANEGKVDFKRGKKPENLLKRIVSLSTIKGDIVFDSFLGSGTTAAVAHKMGRRWIGVELGDHCYTHCAPRLKKICDGTDQSGISKAVDWKGGGGFKFYELAPSLLKKDKYDNWIIDERYNADMLASAMAKHEGFKYSPSVDLYWKQGQSTEKDFIFTTTQMVTAALLDRIMEEMKPDESLLICCKSYQKACDNKYVNISIKKIPNMLLGRCEFGKEDYSLNIIDMPHDEDEPDFVPVGPEGEKKPKKKKKKDDEPSLF